MCLANEMLVWLAWMHPPDLNATRRFATKPSGQFVGKRRLQSGKITSATRISPIHAIQYDLRTTFQAVRAKHARCSIRLMISITGSAVSLFRDLLNRSYCCGCVSAVGASTANIV